MMTLFGKRAFAALMLTVGAFATGTCGSDSGPEDFASGGSSTGGAASGGASGGAPASASGGTQASASGGAPAVGTGNPNFLGPFCEGKPRHVIGITTTPASADATDAEMRQYMLDAVNTIRAMTNLPALKMDACLNKIADTAIADAATGGVHGYFKNNCMNAAHNFGKSCECNWAQENYGAAGGSSYTWKDTLNVPVCGMMDEPKGVGHRGNIENKEWTRLGVGIIKKGTGSTQWVHEFGR
jgi:uncharacterized protein YkwD